MREWGAFPTEHVGAACWEALELFQDWLLLLLLLLITMVTFSSFTARFLPFLCLFTD